MENLKLNIPILMGTVRKGRRSEAVAQYIFQQLQKQKEVQTEWLDLRTYNFVSMEERYRDMETIPPTVTLVIEKMKAADGLIIVSPEYKNSFPGSLKNMLDYLPAQIFQQKPIGISTVSSGGFGGINCLTQLRLVCLAMGGMPIPGKLLVSKVQDMFDAEGALLQPTFEAKTNLFIKEILWYATAMKWKKNADKTHLST